MTEVVWSLLTVCYKGLPVTPVMIIINHPRGLQIGANVANADRWIILWRVCCKLRPCTTTTDAFYDISLNLHVLSVCIINHCDYFGEDTEFTPSNYRKAAYRQYILYNHGYLGRGNRKVVPSCGVWKVRDHYPAPDNNYLGFKEYYRYYRLHLFISDF